MSVNSQMATASQGLVPMSPSTPAIPVILDAGQTVMHFSDLPVVTAPSILETAQSIPLPSTAVTVDKTPIALASTTTPSSDVRLALGERMNAAGSLFFAKDAQEVFKLRDVARSLCMTYTVDVPASYAEHVLGANTKEPVDEAVMLSAHTDLLHAAHGVFAGHFKAEIEAELSFKHLNFYEWMTAEKLSAVNYVDLVSLGLLSFGNADRLLQRVIATKQEGKNRVDYALDQGASMANPFFMAFRVGLYAFATPALVDIMNDYNVFQWQNDVWNFDLLSGMGVFGMLFALDLIITTANKDIRSAKRGDTQMMQSEIDNLILTRKQLEQFAER